MRVTEERRTGDSACVRLQVPCNNAVVCVLVSVCLWAGFVHYAYIHTYIYIYIYIHTQREREEIVTQSDIHTYIPYIPYIPYIHTHTHTHGRAAVNAQEHECISIIHTNAK
jgi:hypothetical protein